MLIVGLISEEPDAESLRFSKQLNTVRIS